MDHGRWTDGRRRTALAGAAGVLGAVLALSGCGGTGGAASDTAAADSATGQAVAAADGGTAPATAPAAAPGKADLASPKLKETAMELVSSAENSSLNWKSQYAYLEDIHDDRGYTGGIIGFCSGTGDMLQLVQHYAQLHPGNVLAKYLPALTAVNGSASHKGLDPGFTADWRTAASDPAFQRAQDDERDQAYFDPAVNQAKADGLNALGQFVYYDAMVMHGQGDDPQSFGGIRAAALQKARTPAQGGDETAYLNAFLDARRAAMKADPTHQETSRVDTEQRAFLKAGNLALSGPLTWTVHGDQYKIAG
ncbi:chitosanase [Kitasatospora sp. NPDC058965]|uniref:chitosanase n=1 Tax=Kitasatospora sp. NPDC058965 TaxID=3346682 RepID=UPI003680FFF0